MTKRRVLLTGATGFISHQLIDVMKDRYDLILTDSQVKSDYRDVTDVIQIDLTNQDIDSYREHFKGVDTIIHNAFYRSPGHISSAPKQWLEDQPPGNPDGYYVERQNLDMAFHVFRLALEENVKRVIVTSSNHATDWYETQLHSGKCDMVGPVTLPRSNNFYGWAKATYEHMGFVFATGRFGRPVENIHVRIGGPRPVVAEKHQSNPTSLKRELGAFLSERDLQQLYLKSVETENILNEDGLPFQIFYGVSNNTRAFWSIANARKVIGYTPEDDSELLYGDEIRRCLSVPGRTIATNS